MFPDQMIGHDRDFMSDYENPLPLPVTNSSVIDMTNTVLECTVLHHDLTNFTSLVKYHIYNLETKKYKKKSIFLGHVYSY